MGCNALACRFREPCAADITQVFGGEGTLLRRSLGRVYLTEAGHLFLASCEAMMSVASEACRAVQDYKCAARLAPQS